VGVKGKGKTVQRAVHAYIANLPASSDHEIQTLQDTAELEMEENDMQGDEDINEEIENIFGSRQQMTAT